MKIDRAVIEINGGCNYSCHMCPQGSEKGRDKRFLKKMGLEEFERNVIDCVQHGLNVVNLDGSGEATLNRDLPKYIEIVKKHGAKAFIFSNGFRMHGDFMKECVRAGLDFFRFSVIGYDTETYSKWMDRPEKGYNYIWDNIVAMQTFVDTIKSDCVVSTYHLILGDDPDADLKQYLNQHDKIERIIPGVKTEIWKMHNWSGVYDNEDKREGAIKTCGRPFSPDVVIRAGGLDGKTGAVAPCCQVLGQDENAVLGHTSERSIEEIWNGPEYQKLRDDHTSGNYPDYCKTCDFLIDAQDVLVYSNYDRSLNHMHGTEFDLNDYRDIQQYLPSL